MVPEKFADMDIARRSNLENDDWIDLYLSEFPEEERRDVDQLRNWLESGLVVLHETRNREGELVTWSMSQDYTSTDPDEPSFWLGCWTVTRRSEQGNGLGRVHLPKVIEALKTEKPGYIGRLTEIESTEGLPADSQPVRRARFYQALGLRELDIPYTIPLYQPVDADEYIPQSRLGTGIAGQLLFAPFDESKSVTGIQARSIIKRMYCIGYGISTDDPFINERLSLIEPERADLLVPVRIKDKK